MIFHWRNATSDELRLLKIISILVDQDDRLLSLLFEPTAPKLRKRAGILKEDTWKLSDGEALLVRAALDIWSGSGHVQLWELIETWDEDNWSRFIKAIQELKNLDGHPS